MLGKAKEARPSLFREKKQKPKPKQTRHVPVSYAFRGAVHWGDLETKSEGGWGADPLGEGEGLYSFWHTMSEPHLAKIGLRLSRPNLSAEKGPMGIAYRAEREPWLKQDLFSPRVEVFIIALPSIGSTPSANSG